MLHGSLASLQVAGWNKGVEGRRKNGKGNERETCKKESKEGKEVMKNTAGKGIDSCKRK